MENIVKSDEKDKILDNMLSQISGINLKEELRECKTAVSNNIFDTHKELIELKLKAIEIYCKYHS